MKQWAAEMLLALEALHQQGVLCRDLNPQNLLLDKAGKSLLLQPHSSRGSLESTGPSSPLPSSAPLEKT